MRVPFDELYGEILRAFLALGMEREAAALCARTHAENSRDGVYSHGANRVPRFAHHVREGWVDIHTKPALVKSLGAIEVWDGNFAPGITNAYHAVERAMALAKEHGIGMVGLRHTSHFMRAGTYAAHAARKGFAFIGWTNTESCMPPWGGKEQRLGNDPFAMAAPALPGEEPVVLDIAMSQFAYGKLQVTRQAGKQLPVPGGYDDEGELTCDPGTIEANRRILPMGYWKGSAMAFMLDILGAILTDGIGAADIDKTGRGSCGGCSQVFIAIDAQRISDAAHIRETIETAKAHIASSAPAEEGSVRWPGEGAVKAREENLREGVFVDDAIWAEIKAL